jgi:hypothetical protein
MKKTIKINLMNIKQMPKDGKGFNFLVSLNRDIKPGQVTTIAYSVEKMGVIRPIVAAEFTYLGKKGLYIIDGQHLYHALLRNNMDFPYVEIKIESDRDLVEQIALLNSSSKSWTLLDYIQAWSYVNPHYKTLMKHFNTYDLEILQIASILHCNRVGAGQDGSTISRLIKKGQFNVINEEKCIKLFDCITDTLKIIPRMDRTSNKTFVSAYVDYYNCTPNYDHHKFLEFLRKNIKQLQFVTADKNTLSDFLKRNVN